MLFAFSTSWGQNAQLLGQLLDSEEKPVGFAYVALFGASDSVLVKVEATEDSGNFSFSNLKSGTYFLKSSFVGLPELVQRNIQVAEGEKKDLGVLRFGSNAELKEVVVTGERVLVEVRADRTVFNVEGTINAVGNDALTLLRKAPGVTVDNNDNVNVLGRSGVIVYVDGRRLPLSGQDLTAYLQNLTAEQIDRIDIIANPGAKYEAEGNAGILDIRLKKNKNHGANGSMNYNGGQGRYFRQGINGNGNYRTAKLNLFGSAGWNGGDSYNDMLFESYQNGLFLDEINTNKNTRSAVDLRLGTDFFLSEKHTIGFLVSGQNNNSLNTGLNRIEIAQESVLTQVDSILVATNTNDAHRLNYTANANYAFDNRKNFTANFDLDFGRYQNDQTRAQPNRYFNAQETQLLSEYINFFDMPSTIDIYSAKLDLEQKVWGGVLGYGTKAGRVVSDNTFLFYDVFDAINQRNDQKSNEFEYTENVYAGYLNFAAPINQKWSYSLGLRAEYTDALGNLQTFLPDLSEPPVVLQYWRYFPSGGLTWQAAPMHNWVLNFGRRINRPDYNVLNPFNNQLSQLSYEKGNPFLRPEIVNNVELGYTFAYRFNFKLAYSHTADQITRLIAPDENDPRAGFISWDNLASQQILNLNISAPFSPTKGVDTYVNFSASYLNNQADYGNGAVVDLQAGTFNLYQQTTFPLGNKWKGEVSGWLSGPGIWGGVFRYKTQWSLDLGLQRKFFAEKLNCKISATDLFYTSGWRGVSEFSGLKSFGRGNWDSRRIALSLSYNFGNQNVKSRKRDTGISTEEKRLGN